MDNHLVTYPKILIPSLRPETFSRPRLLDHCYGLLDYRLALLIAPAGYGKTTLLVDLAHSSELPVCWYSLDGLDKDPRRFLNHFIAALARRFPEFGKTSMTTLRSMSGSIDWKYLLTVLVNDAYDHIQEHFLLIVDDYHLVDSCEEIGHFISQFVQYADENCHLILSSRIPPALPDLPLMIARSQIGGLDYKKLAFQPDEIQALISGNYNLTISSDTAESLFQETEGWITGLLLSAQTLGQTLTEHVQTARVSQVGLYDYLAQQVLNQQSGRLQEFLLCSSLLEVFDAELCAAVLDPEARHKKGNWQALIDEASQKNLFIQSVGDDRKWFRYHHLFQEFLQTQITEKNPEKKDVILRRLAHILTERGEWERAYELFSRLKDIVGRANLIEEVGLAMIIATRQTTLAQWIDELPAEILWSRPALLSLRGSVAVDLGQMTQGLGLLNQAKEMAEETGDLTCLAYTLIRRASTYLIRARCQEALTDVETALELKIDEKEGPVIRAIAFRVKGLTLHQMGRLEPAVTSLSKALQLNEMLGRKAPVAMLHNDLGTVFRALGEYEEAQVAYQRALDAWQQSGNIADQAFALNNLGVLHHYQGEYEEAGRILDQAVSCARRSDFKRALGLALASIGDLYSDLQAFDEAGDAYQEAEEIARHIKYTFLQIYLLIAQARVFRLQGDLASARNGLQQAGQVIKLEGLGSEISMYHLEFGRLLLAEGNIGAAIEHLRQAADNFCDGDQLVEAACACLTLARAYEKDDKKEEMTAALAKAFNLVAGLKHCHFMIVTGREVKTLLERVTGDPSIGRFAAQLQQKIEEFEASIPLWRRRLRRQATAVPFAQPALVVQALGGTQVNLAGKVIGRPEWKSRLAGDMLFLLLAHPQGLAKEEIGVFFWPDSPPSKMKLNFEKTIYRLRVALTRDVVVFDEQDDRYYFNWDLDYRYDVGAFQTRLAEAQQADNPAEAIARYEKALEIYQGHYLPDLEGMWVLQQRETLSHSYREAVINLATLCLEQGDYQPGLRHCAALLAEDPYLETAHRLVMRIHAAQGNLADVARQFTHCKDVLQDELQISPSDQTIQLYASLVQNRKS